MRNIALLLLLSVSASAAPTEIALWPGTPPGRAAAPGRQETSPLPAEHPVAGKTWHYIARVSTPTVTVYPATGKNTGAAVLVFPGGGYEVLAIDLEGTEVCDWLNPKGIACAVLKYRVPCAKVGPYRDCPEALQDAQRALALIRARASEWGIDPKKVGVLGFSAGGHMSASISNHFDRRAYARVDAADDQSARPDFSVVLYPGHLASDGRPFNPDVRVSSSTPPTILIQAEDDPVDPVENSLFYHAALRKAKAPVELHLFAKGGHAFGLRRTQNPVTHWSELVERWLVSIGIVPPTEL